MKKSVKLALIALAVGFGLIVLGAIIFTISMSLNGWDFSKISNTVVEYKVYEVEKSAVNSLEIQFTVSDITYEEYDGDKITVEYPIIKNKKGEQVNEVLIENGEKLSVCEKSKQWGFWWSVNYSKTKVTVKVPREMGLAVNLKTNTGRVTVGDGKNKYNMSSLQISTDTGAVTLISGITCEGKVNLYTDAGDVTVDGVLSASSLNVDVKTGRITFSKTVSLTETAILSADTGSITVKSGLVAISVKMQTDTGRIDVSNGTVNAKNLYAESDTGSITVKLVGKKEDYTVNVEMDTGKSNISSFTGGERTVEITVDTGNINVYFNE